jgi:hypothetical protein
MKALNPSSFAGINSYKAYLYAQTQIIKLIDLQAEGSIILDGKSVIKGKYFINNESLEIGIKENSGKAVFITLIVGCTHGGPNYDKVYITKKTVNEYLSRISVINPSHINKFNRG